MEAFFIQSKVKVNIQCWEHTRSPSKQKQIEMKQISTLEENLTLVSQKDPTHVKTTLEAKGLRMDRVEQAYPLLLSLLYSQIPKHSEWFFLHWSQHRIQNCIDFLYTKPRLLVFIDRRQEKSCIKTIWEGFFKLSNALHILPHLPVPGTDSDILICTERRTSPETWHVTVREEEG